MLKYLSSFIWDEPDEIKPSERQVQLRYLLHRQITLNNMTLKAVDDKPSVADGLIDYELQRLTKTVAIKRKKTNKRKYFQSKR